mgnify:CR=1 FL=1
MNTSTNLSVQLYKSMHLPCTAKDTEDTTTSNSDRYLEVQVSYLPDCASAVSMEDRAIRESADRDWFKVLVDLNPNIDNLAAAVDHASKVFIDSVMPRTMQINVTLSGTADRNEFCTKYVSLDYSRDVEVV